MLGKILYGVQQEIAEGFGLKTVTTNVNFSKTNTPQVVLPAAAVSVTTGDTVLYVGGIQRQSYTVLIEVSILDLNVSLRNNSSAAIEGQMDAYSIASRIEYHFNERKFKSPILCELFEKNNLIMKTRGMNQSSVPYGDSSKRVITYDLVVDAYVTPIPCHDEVPIQSTEQETEIVFEIEGNATTNSIIGKGE